MNFLKLALSNTLVYGDTDIFPHPYEYDLLKDKVQLLQRLLLDIDGNYNKSDYCSLFVSAKKNKGEFRIATLIDPILHLDYLVLAIQIAEQTELNRVKKNEHIVHSYRFMPNKENGKLFDSSYGFHSFKKAINTKVESFEGWVTNIDIKEFYASISKELLERVLVANNIPKKDIERLRNILAAINVVNGKGLPIGGNASRILAELVLNEIDQYLVSIGITFVRFVDDCVVFSAKGNEIKDIDLIHEKLSNLELEINYRKLKISESCVARLESDFINNLPLYNNEPELVDGAQVEIMLQEQLRQITKDKFLNLGQLKFITDEMAINRIIWQIADNLGFLHKGFGTLVQWVMDNIDKVTEEVFVKIHTAVEKLLVMCHSVVDNEINIAFAVRLLGAIESPETQIQLDNLYRRYEKSSLVRLSIIQVFVKWEDKNWLKDNIVNTNNLNLWEQRAILIGLEANNSIIDKNNLAPWDILLWS